MKNRSTDSLLAERHQITTRINQHRERARRVDARIRRQKRNDRARCQHILAAIVFNELEAHPEHLFTRHVLSLLDQHVGHFSDRASRQTERDLMNGRLEELGLPTISPLGTSGSAADPKPVVARPKTPAHRVTVRWSVSSAHPRSSDATPLAAVWRDCA